MNRCKYWAKRFFSFIKSHIVNVTLKTPFIDLSLAPSNLQHPQQGAFIFSERLRDAPLNHLEDLHRCIQSSNSHGLLDIFHSTGGWPDSCN